MNSFSARIKGIQLRSLELLKGQGMGKRKGAPEDAQYATMPFAFGGRERQ